MSAYIIVDIKVKDPVRYEHYKQLAQESIAAHGGRYIVRGGKVETLEGTWPLNRLVVLEFESVERARAWYDSLEYAEGKALRNEVADARMILVEGL